MSIVFFICCRTVILEVPHFADLCNGQREIAVLNCSEAGVWTEHQQEPLEKQIEEALNISMATEGTIIIIVFANFNLDYHICSDASVSNISFKVTEISRQNCSYSLHEV